MRTVTAHRTGMVRIWQTDGFGHEFSFSEREMLADEMIREIRAAGTVLLHARRLFDDGLAIEFQKGEAVPTTIEIVIETRDEALRRMAKMAGEVA